MRKRFFAFLLVLATVFSLVACAGAVDSVTTTTSGSDSNGLFTDYLPTDSIEDVVSSDVPVVSTTTTTTPPTVTQTEPPVTEEPVVSTDTDPVSSETTTTSTFKKTWSYSDKSTNSNNNGAAIVPETWEPLNVVKNRVLALDQQAGRVVLYDIAKAVGGNLDKAEEWSFNCGYAAGVKYREGNARFGNVIITAGSKCQIITYPGKQVKWSTKKPGNNPHSIEMLPSGNVVIACSTGGTLRLFDTTKTNDSYKEYKLTGAHGVLWDPANKLLWALGDNELISYTVTGSGSSEALVKKNTYKLPQTGGHDLAPDYFSKDHLYLTVVNTVYRFHKPSGTFLMGFYGSSAIETYPDGNGNVTKARNVKGFGVNENNGFFYCFPNFGKGTSWANDSKAEWCTDQIHFIRQTGARTYATEVYKSSKSAYYKCRVFSGKYQ
ncbi:MAG: hypothetical protein J6M34_05705 [Clostridia bacterium]|nr:hypothetical protein [Clostridia bacterium]